VRAARSRRAAGELAHEPLQRFSVAALDASRANLAGRPVTNTGAGRLVRATAARELLPLPGVQVLGLAADERLVSFHRADERQRRMAVLAPSVPQPGSYLWERSPRCGLPHAATLPR